MKSTCEYVSKTKCRLKIIDTGLFAHHDSKKYIILTYNDLFRWQKCKISYYDIWLGLIPNTRGATLQR